MLFCCILQTYYVNIKHVCRLVLQLLFQILFHKMLKNIVTCISPLSIEWPSQKVGDDRDNRSQKNEKRNDAAIRTYYI